MFLQYYLNENGDRVYTLKVPVTVFMIASKSVTMWKLCFCVFALFFLSIVSRFSSFKLIKFWGKESVSSVKPLKLHLIFDLENAVEGFTLHFYVLLC